VIFIQNYGLPFVFFGIKIKTIKSLKKINMKNSFKLGVLALAIAVSFAACKGKGGSGSADSAKDTAKMDTAAKMADTAKKMADTAKKMADTAKKMATDTAKKK
jgi:hypothetical protein